MEEELQKWSEVQIRARCVRRLLSYVKDNNRLPLFAIAARFRNADGDAVSERPIRRYQHKNGIRS